MNKDKLKSLTPELLLQEAESLFDKVEALETELKNTKKALAKAGEEYAELAKKLDAAESGKKGTKVFGTVKVGKVEYEIVRPKINYGQQIYTAEQISESPDLAAALVKIGATCLRSKE